MSLGGFSFLDFSFQVYFVDKQRNAAVVIGDRDLKTDVNNKRKRERYSDHDEKHFVTRCQDAGRG